MGRVLPRRVAAASVTGDQVYAHVVPYNKLVQWGAFYKRCKNELLPI